VQVDGGAGRENIRELVDAGARLFVAGTRSSSVDPADASPPVRAVVSPSAR
jgi:pentose-5-phosphate-3-epimerase